MKPLNGFTLIELLIVVAIIAILAAIAVPNFLEAQTRAKISRIKADMRSTATAIETYIVDYNKYPFYLNPLDEDFATNYNDHAAPITDGRYELRVPVRLSTPISYMTSLQVDVFPNLKGEEDTTAHPFHYCSDQDPFTANPSAAPGLDQAPVKGIYSMVGASSNTPSFYLSGSPEWMLVSHGPDVDHDNPDEAEEPRSYDATNGTISNGDIYYFGPGLGFK